MLRVVQMKLKQAKGGKGSRLEPQKVKRLHPRRYSRQDLLSGMNALQLTAIDEDLGTPSIFIYHWRKGGGLADRH